MNATITKTGTAAPYSEAARMLQFLRAIGTEEQRIAYTNSRPRFVSMVASI